MLPFKSGTIALALATAMIGMVQIPAETRAQDRQIITTEDADYFGADYETVKDVELEGCKAACIADTRCNAFTYNRAAKWCFLKQDFGALKRFSGAVAGRIAQVDSAADALRQKRRQELGFLNQRLISEAEAQAAKLKDFYDPAGTTYSVLLADAGTAYRDGKTDRAEQLYGSALVLAPESLSTWYRYALSLLYQKSKDWKKRQRIESGAISAAINAFLRADHVNDRANSLSVLAMALERRRAYLPAIRAFRASLALKDDKSMRERYDKLVANHGFRVTEHTVDADAASPRICVTLSEKLQESRPNLTDFIDVADGSGLAIEAAGNQICIDGVAHGKRYAVTLRAGLPADNGEALEKAVPLDLYVRDRAPSVRFLGKAYVLPRGKDATIPIASVNAKIIEAQIHRYGDRALADIVTGNGFLTQLDRWEPEEIENRTGERVWSGEIDVASKLNIDVTTAVPVGEAVKTLKPGAYVMTARAKGDTADRWGPLATQWFIVTDLGLSALSGNDGLHGFVRSLNTADPEGSVTLRLVAANNEVLGETTTDEAGHGRFAAGFTRGSGGMAPALLVAEGPDGDYAFLDLTKSAFDLTDRGVAGRPAPGAVDAYLYTDRGVYRPGETVHVTALIRDTKGAAMADLPVTFVLERPDGVENRRERSVDQGAGGHSIDLTLDAGAMRGQWRLRAHLDPKGKPVAEQTVLVEDFQPERLDFNLKAGVDRFDPDRPASFDLASRYLYGAPAADLPVEAEILVRTAKGGLAAYPGYRFGLADEKVQQVRDVVAATIRTDGQGNASFAADLPQITAPTRLLEAELIARMSDAGGRGVERTLTLPVTTRGPRIGIRPLFKDDQAAENSAAGFEVIMVAADGSRIARRNVGWTLNRIHTSYQWYKADGRWTYERFADSERIADGKLDLTAEAPASLSMPVEWGRYRLELTTTDGKPTASSIDFNAGWVTTGDAAETPDMLPVGLDKASYQVGETARLHIEPRFAGKAMIAVIDDHLIETRLVDIAAEGTTIELPVTEAWGSGAYVVANLYRPMNVDAKRMPSRALGLAWAKVDPGARKLAVAIDGADVARPRGPAEITIDVADVPAGTEAFVTVAAVDLGILNLTQFKAPAPDDWYFGQRKLGTEIRDLYGRLIDRMQGVRGTIRSGGDGAAPRLSGTPPVDDLVAYYSGIRKVDADGKVRVVVDIPDFNGTMRVMAVAWTANAVGHAVKDVIARDPVVVTASNPAYLAPGDQSRLLLDIANVEGAAGAYTLSVDGGPGLTIGDGGGHQMIDLAAGERKTRSIPVGALTVGRHELTATLTGPNGGETRKTVTIAVRSGEAPVTRSNFVQVPAGGSLTIDQEMASGLIGETTSATVAVSRAARLDVPGLLESLDRYPYGCSEQLTSRALPLVYFGDVARSAGLADDDQIRDRVNKAITGILANQASNGGFGLWRPGSGDTWLDAYITDFLGRAKEAGYDVRQAAFDLALDNLSNRMAYTSDLSDGGRDVAYALYVLARNGRAAIGDLRYYADARMDRFDTPLAKAQVGAALALYGENDRAKSAFKAAVAALGKTEDANLWRTDYGSSLRDSAAVLTLAAETKSANVDLQPLTARILRGRAATPRTSTQENAWLLLAAHALTDIDNKNDLVIDGEAVNGAVFRKFAAGHLQDRAIVIENRGGQDLEAVLTATGVPVEPEPATEAGYTITRSHYDLEGRQIEISDVAQNTRFVTVLTIAATADEQARLIVSDPLPAGFVIDNANLLRGGDVGALNWLTLEEAPRHVEFRADKFVAAIDREVGANDINLAYIARAVAPGTYAHPAATVEDMYRPYRYGRMASGMVTVTADQ